MSLLYAAAIAIIAASGVFLILSRQVVRILLGVALLSAAVNLAILYAGRLVSTLPPVIPAGQTILAVEAANPLPQALILTAIVIGFALVAFVAALALRIQRSFDTLDERDLNAAEQLGSPFDEGGARP